MGICPLQRAIFSGNIANKKVTANLYGCDFFIKEIIGKSDEFTHRECVKVYRNVQALLDEQNKKLEESTEAVKVQMESCKAADLTEDVAYLKRVLNMTYSSTKANRVWLVIVALLSAANLACILLIHFGLL